MNNVQLELEKIIEEFDKFILQYENKPEKLYIPSTKHYNDGVLRGLSYAKERCERLMEVVTGVYPESQLEDIQE